MKVSVIIPFYKNPHLFKRTIYSLFNQTISDIEFIFINDGSTEIPESLISDFFSKFSGNNHKLIILKNESNKGISFCRKLGIQNSSGEYIAFCDSDDYTEPDMYIKLYQMAVKKNADIVACGYYVEGKETKVINKTYGCHSKKILRNIYGNCEIALWDKIFKRELLINNYIYPLENYNYYEDCFITIKALYYAKTIVTIPDPLYHYITNPDSASKKSIIDNLKSMNKYIKELDLFFKEQEPNSNIYRTLMQRLKFQYKLKIKDINSLSKKEWYQLYNETHSQILKFTDIPFWGRLKLYWLIKIGIF